MAQYRLSLFIVAGYLLAACGEDGYSSPPVSVTAESGDTVELTGTWKSICHQDGSDYIIDVRVYSSNGRLTVKRETYTETDCSGTATTTTYATAVSVTTGSDKTMAGWTGTKPGHLSTTPDVTKYTYKQDDNATIKSVDLVDDSTDSWDLYQADTGAATDIDDYPEYLLADYPLSKQ